MGQPIDTASVAIVPDFSGFASAARRDIDRPLQEVAREAERAFGQVERAAAEAGADIAVDMRRGGAIAEQAIREVGNQGKIMAGEVAASSAAAGSSLGGRLAAGAAVAKTAILGVGAAATLGLAAIAGFGLKSAAQLEQTQIGFESLLGSAQEAKDFLVELQQFAAVTPFQFQGIADASRRILAFGTSVGITKDQVIPTITVIGDLVSVLGGTQENTDGVIRAFGQIASKGRLMGGEILQIAEQLPGFNANQAIAAHLGVSVAEALRLQEAGAIDAQTAIDGLLEGMANFPGAAGAMERQAFTLLGVFSTFKDTIGIALTGAFQPVIPAIKTALSEVTPIIGEAVNQLAPALGHVLSSLLPLIGTLVQALVPILVPLLDAISQTIPLLTPVLAPLGAAIGQIVAAIAPLLPLLGQTLATAVLALVPLIAQLAVVFADIAPQLDEMLIAVIPLIPSLIELAVALTPLLGLTLRLAALMVSLESKFLIGPVVKALAFAINILAEAFGFLTGFLTGTNWAGVLEAIGGAFVAAGTAIVGFFQGLPGRIVGFLRDLPARLGALLEAAAFAVGFGIGRLARFFFELPGQILAFLATLPGRLVAFFTTTGEQARTVAVSKFGQIVDFVKAVPGKVIDALQALPGQIAGFAADLGPKVIQLGRDIVGGIIKGIKDTIGGIGRALWSGVSSAVDGLIGGLGIGSPSKLLADQVGRWLPAGINQGVIEGTPGLLTTIAGLVGDISAITGRGAPSSSLTVDVGGVVVNGSATVADATSIGATVGRSVASAARRTQLALAVRSK